jgi:hypothetical protein
MGIPRVQNLPLSHVCGLSQTIKGGMHPPLIVIPLILQQVFRFIFESSAFNGDRGRCWQS